MFDFLLFELIIDSKISADFVYNWIDRCESDNNVFRERTVARSVSLTLVTL